MKLRDYATLWVEVEVGDDGRVTLIRSNSTGERGRFAMDEKEWAAVLRAVPIVQTRLKAAKDAPAPAQDEGAPR